ncbi:MAG: hypothetical protein ACTMUB_03915 [cyanobacterium endosymbiont of Rhopalodia musculus]
MQSQSAVGSIQTKSFLWIVAAVDAMEKAALITKEQLKFLGLLFLVFMTT